MASGVEDDLEAVGEAAAKKAGKASRTVWQSKSISCSLIFPEKEF
jgi:hypothetical protein